MDKSKEKNFLFSKVKLICNFFILCFMIMMLSGITYARENTAPTGSIVIENAIVLNNGKRQHIQEMLH